MSEYIVLDGTARISCGDMHRVECIRIETQEGMPIYVPTAGWRSGNKLREYLETLARCHNQHEALVEALSEFIEAWDAGAPQSLDAEIAKMRAALSASSPEAAKGGG